jgi:hypothetical protein
MRKILRPALYPHIDVVAGCIIKSTTFNPLYVLAAISMLATNQWSEVINVTYAY